MSLRASGNIHNTHLFISPTPQPQNLSTISDLTAVADFVFTQASKGEISTLDMDQACVDGFENSDRITCMLGDDKKYINMMRLGLTSNHNVIGGTYMGLHAIKIADIEQLSTNRFKIQNLIDRVKFNSILKEKFLITFS